MTAGLHLRSQYIAMPDGVALAVDVWRPESVAACPVVLGFTRYWRGYDLDDPTPHRQRLFGAAAYFAGHGIAFVMCDVRGTGASFGTRTCEYSDAEVKDYAAVAGWVRAQAWCSGAVVTFGVSYSGNAALLAAAHGGAALKAVMPNFIDYDLYQHSICPGGVPNRWMAENWGGLTAALDANDFRGAARFQPIPPGAEALDAVRGVKPVDDDRDGSKRDAAVRAHAGNFRTGAQTVVYADCPLGRGGETVDDIGIHARLDAINAAGVPVHLTAGWFDGGTAVGAVTLFNALDVPCRVSIGPWNHGMTYHVDPFGSQDPADQIRLAMADCLGPVIDVLRAPRPAGKVLRYYTYGLNAWRATECWPVKGQRPVAVYCARGALTPVQPTDEGFDPHALDDTATTGTLNRWHTQIGSTPVVYPGRGAAGGYDTPPLAADCELTGTPAVTIHLRTDATDAILFFCLDAVAPDGRVALLSDGCFRALHRAGTLDGATAGRLGRRHSFRRADARPLAPGEVAVVRCDLMPMSAVVAKGHRLRLSITGGDRDTFVVFPDAARRIDVMRGSQIALPVVSDSLVFS